MVATGVMGLWRAAVRTPSSAACPRGMVSVRVFHALPAPTHIASAALLTQKKREGRLTPATRRAGGRREQQRASAIEWSHARPQGPRRRSLHVLAAARATSAGVSHTPAVRAPSLPA
jgi:hypothetical protein